MGNTIYVLTESIDEGITRMWYFQAESKLAMAQWMLDHLAQCEATEMFRGISWLSGLARWYHREERTPESLLLAIDKTSIDGDSESRFEIHRIDLSENGGRAQDVTWIRAEE